MVAETKRAFRAVLFCIACAVATFGSYHVGLAMRGKPARAPVLQAGSELVMVFVGASTCRWSTTPELADAVRSAMRLLEVHARAVNRRLVTVGIAKDIDVHAGLRHLAGVASFDEVSTGRGWLNSGVLHYMFADHQGTAATPQIVILLRETKHDADGTGVLRETMVTRKVGVVEIRRWVGLGARLPATVAVAE